ncbi:hypothetical protein Lalb_Chr06g0172551 [Lupinus albus]|uniref:Uncharacterized protein n=1 Tax=Lupinus albus TaxID=3870 RepID=A0A6A4QFJ7_LUPAL|nr:hypothetical protein Lalb_Chr06g0172551 [Lupinus albus]
MATFSAKQKIKVQRKIYAENNNERDKGEENTQGFLYWFTFLSTEGYVQYSCHTRDFSTKNYEL